MWPGLKTRAGEGGGRGKENGPGMTVRGRGDSGPASRPGDLGQAEEKQPSPEKAVEEACPGEGRAPGCRPEGWAVRWE